MDLLNTARFFVGAPPYDKPGNYGYRDGYLAVAAKRKWGEKAWEEAVKKAEAEKSRT